MMKLKQLLRQPEFHLFVFCLLFMLCNWPFLSIAGSHGLMGIFVYLFVVWAALILLLFFIQRSLRGTASGEDGDEEGGG